MKRHRVLWASLLACAAACSTYGQDDPNAPPPAPTAADASTDSGASDTGEPGTIDLTDDGGLVIDDSGVPVDATADARPIPNLRVFLSSKTLTGRFNSASPESVADALCQSAASGLSPPGTFKAWLSAPLGTAADRILNTARGRTYELLNGRVLGLIEEMVDHPLKQPIAVDESGAAQLTTTPVWTGTGLAGNSSALNCAGWTSADPTHNGTASTASIAPNWASGDSAPCNVARHFFCFEMP